jgi:hypothetical protein
MLESGKQLLFIVFLFSIIKNGTTQTTFTSIINDDLYTSGQSIVNGLAWTNSVAYKGNRFCGSNNWKEGSVLFNGRWYSGLEINYDVLEDELIFYDETPGSEKYIQLNKDLIERFNYIDENTQRNFVLKELSSEKGKEIYEEIYRGAVSFYIKHKKSVKEEIGTKYMGKLYDSNTFYLDDGQQSYSFKKRKKVLEILGNSRELKTFIRKENLRINKNHQNDIVRLLEYYQSLIKAN